jgi:uncharacterized protein
MGIFRVMSDTKKPSFSVANELLAVCRLPVDTPLPVWALSGDFFSITRTAEELSLVCLESVVDAAVPFAGLQVERGWRSLKVIGPLDFALTGILAGIASTLADAGISLFALSTYDTDYILVRQDTLTAAVEALSRAGYGL